MNTWEHQEVDRLELNNEWNLAINVLIKEWEEDPQNFKIYIRLSFILWYLSVEWDTITPSDISYERVDDMLMRLYNFGTLNFNFNQLFLSIYGYMISLFPNYFGEDYEEMLLKGNLMIQEAYKLDSRDPLIKAIYLKNRVPFNKNEFIFTIKENKKDIMYKFQGEGEFQRYFKEVLFEL